MSSQGTHKETATLRLTDGRLLCYRTYGARDGTPILALHGTPGSRLKFEPADKIALEFGLHLISVDRWGYGGTSAHPSPSLEAFGNDCRALLDHLRVIRTCVVAISGGGPFAVGAAVVLGERIERLALVAPVGPIARSGLGMRALGPFHTLAFRVLPNVPGAGRSIFAPFRQVALASPPTSTAIATLRATASDRQLMRDRVHRARLGATFAEGLRSSTQGPAIDLRIFGSRWDVDCGQVCAHAKIWIGRQDRNVPIAAAINLSRLMPNCALELLPDAGHFWIVQNFDRVLNWLAGRPETQSADRGTRSEIS